MRLWLAIFLALTLCAGAQTHDQTGGMTADEAVGKALLENPSVQALYRQVEISQADLDQASLLVNPMFEASVRFPDQGGLPTNTEFMLSWNLLDLLRRGDRAELADTELRQARFQVEDELLDFSREVKAQFYHVQSQRQSVDQLDIVLQAASAALELHKRQFQAGNIPQVALAQQEAAETEARIALEQARFRLEQEQAELNMLMGQPPDQPVQVARLSDIPEHEIALEGLESKALANRPDVALARLEIEAAEKSLTLESGGLIDDITFGVSSETDSEAGGPTVTGPSVSFPVPLFDRKQGKVAHFRARAEQGRSLLAARELRAKTEVRVAYSKLEAARRKVERLRDELVPKRRQILLLSRPYYDSMLLGVYPLLQFRQDLAQARLELIEAIADYWTARAGLERAVGGKL